MVIQAAGRCDAQRMAGKRRILETIIDSSIVRDILYHLIEKGACALLILTAIGNV